MTELKPEQMAVHMQFNEYTDAMPVKYIMEAILGTKISRDKKLQELISFFEFEDCLRKKYSKLSGGQKRKCEIARAILNKPEILILDEPTTGLDPQTRTAIWKLIRDMQTLHGMTVFLTTHYMEEAIYADKVIVMDSGKIVMRGAPKEIFSEVEKLKALRLDVPQVTLLAYELKKKGMPISDGILTMDELVKEIC